jgi:delta-aminolevulinic acid dehydratase/porphobilinogen synthase
MHNTHISTHIQYAAHADTHTRTHTRTRTHAHAHTHTHTHAPQAEAGADCVSPSDMMDGRVGAIRKALDRCGPYYTPFCAMGNLWVGLQW